MINSLCIALGSALLYMIAYHTYGRFLAKKIFKLNTKNICPSVKFNDNVDFVPSNKSILFGHHFTSIAGTGPIVGPAIAVIWGWLPALLWVIFGSVFMGAVHDFGALLISLRNEGRSIGDIAGDIISIRVKRLFLVLIFFGLLIVVAIFGLVIASVFDLYPASVLPVWGQIPIALALGYLVYKKNVPALWPSIIAVVLMYASILAGAYMPLKMPSLEAVNTSGDILFTINPAAIWVVLLLIYVYFASTLPVQVLLQPRDYINSNQLIIAMGLLMLGVIVSRPYMAAPAVNMFPAGAPPIFPTLFIVVACGAISGFHSLVSSGTTSKQCSNERDSLFIGYGSMLIEGMLAVLVIIACAAGIGLGLEHHGKTYFGSDAFSHYYSSWGAVSGLSAKISAFIKGSSKMLESIGLNPKISMTVMGVFIASFAATTLDTATRIQRYIVSEIAVLCKMPFLSRKHPATFVAVATAFILAFHNGASAKGALVLWPLFGCVNQLLAALALLVITVYLAKKKSPVIFTVVPVVFMVGMTGWAMLDTVRNFFMKGNWLLFVIGVIITALEVWVIFESTIILKKVFKEKQGK